MKKLILIGITVGIAGLAQATSVSMTYTLPTGSAIEGNYAYWYEITAANLGLTSGQSISDVSLNFNNITLTTSGHNTLHADLLNIASTSGSAGDSDNPSDYFSTVPGLDYDQIGVKTDLYHNVSRTWSWSITGNVLDHLNNDLATLGAFDIGIDPDCHYTVDSITLTYDTVPRSTPDQAMTAVLMGMSFLGLLVFRRKLALQ